MDKISAMKTFVKIVEKGSLTQAAHDINSSLPTVVRVLATLEHHLKVRLLNRTTRSIALTIEGQQYLAHCQQILADIENAEQSLISQQVAPQGKLVVTAPILFGQMHVTPAVAQFITDHQQVQVELILIDRSINLVEDGVDVAIRIGDLSDSSLIAIPVGSINHVVCASPDYLRQTGDITIPQQLTNHNCVHHNALSSSLYWTFLKQNKKFKVPITSSFQCNQALATIETCIKGIGFGQFLSYQVAPYLKSKQLVRILTDYELPPIPINIIYPHAKLLSTRVRMFVDALTEYLRNVLMTGK